MNDLHDPQTLRRLDRITISAAILLFIGFVMPFAENRFMSHELDWFGLRTITGSDAPWQIRIYMLLPLMTLVVAAISLIVKNPQTKVYLRIVAGFFPLAFVLVAGQLAFLGDSANMLSQLSSPSTPNIGPGLIQMVCLFLGPLAMYVGANASLLKPDSRVPVHIVFAGALLFAIAMVMPQLGSQPGPKALLLTSFYFMGESPVAGIIAMLVEGLMVTAIVVSIIWWAKRNQGAAQGANVRRLLNVAFTVTVAVVLAWMLWIMIRGGAMASFFIVMVIMMAKFSIPAIAWYQLKIVGLAPISAR